MKTIYQIFKIVLSLLLLNSTNFAFSQNIISKSSTMFNYIIRDTKNRNEYDIIPHPSKKNPNIFKDSTETVTSNSTDISLIISNTPFKNLNIDGSFVNINIGSSKFGTLKFTGDNSGIDSLVLTRLCLNDLIFQTNAINKLKMDQDTVTGNLDLSNLVINKNISLKGYIGGFLDLSGFKAGDNVELDLSDIKCYPTSNNKRIPIKLTNSSLQKTDIDKINFDYNKFKLDTNGSAFEENVIIYRKLLDNFKKNDLSSYKLVYIEYNDYLANNEKSFVARFSYLLNKLFWNYGFNDEYLLYWSVGFILFFTMINLFFYQKILITYSIAPFISANIKTNISYPNKPLRRFPIKLFHCFIYTGSIFLGLKFDLEKLNLEKPKIVILLLFEYATGVLFVTYIIHYYFTK